MTVLILLAIGTIGGLLFLIFQKLMLLSKFKRIAPSLIPVEWVPSAVCKGFNCWVVFNEASREVAFITLGGCQVVAFSNVKSWQHLWDDKFTTTRGVFVDKTEHRSVNHTVKVVAKGLPAGSITVFFGYAEQGASELCVSFETLLG